jgi:CheY-like chemotaxis protein
VDGKLQVVVADKGVGFDPAAVMRVGEKSSGFGLFSISERLDFVGGELEIQSQIGKGSRFVLAVPLEGVRPAEGVSRTPGRAAGAARARALPPRSGKPIGVLLADDHQVMREGLAELLGQEPDIEIIGQAADGEAAVELAGKLQPDIILMDISMPKLNGVEATRIIHKEFPDIRIIGLSMFEEPERARVLKDAGAVEYLTKSGPASALVQAIRRAGPNRGAPGGRQTDPTP